MNEAQKELYYDEFIRRKIKDVLLELDKMKLIRLDQRSLSVSSTEIGRVTSHYYIKCETMEHLCSTLHIFAADDPNLIKKKYDFKTDLDILNILSNCK
jgi:replicative superfamily II helicase